MAKNELPTATPEGVIASHQQVLVELDERQIKTDWKEAAEKLKQPAESD